MLGISNLLDRTTGEATLELIRLKIGTSEFNSTFFDVDLESKNIKFANYSIPVPFSDLNVCGNIFFNDIGRKVVFFDDFLNILKKSDTEYQIKDRSFVNSDIQFDIDDIKFEVRAYSGVVFEFGFFEKLLILRALRFLDNIEFNSSNFNREIYFNSFEKTLI